MSINKDNKLACRQASEVIKMMPQRQKELIPQNVIDELNKNAQGVEATIEYNKYGKIQLSKEAKSIIIYLFKNYINENENLDKLITQKLEENENINKKLKAQNTNLKIEEDKNINQKEIKIEKINIASELEEKHLDNVNSLNLFQKLVQKIKSIIKNKFKF